MKQLFTSILALIVLSSCKKENLSDYSSGEKGSLEIEFDNVVGGANLQLNTGVYTNAAGENFSINLLDYYISNIRLKKDDGSEYAMPKDNSYFLIREEDPSQVITLNDVPAGNYTGITFTLGVDSTKCTAPLAERTGVLDPAGAGVGMYWTWNSGYIFVKLEGTSAVATTADKKFRYHIGGFGGYSSPTINNIKTVVLNAGAGASAKVRQNKPEAPHIHIMADIAKVMNGSTNVSIAANTTVMFMPYSVNIANNYAGMFNIDHIHND